VAQTDNSSDDAFVQFHLKYYCGETQNRPWSFPSTWFSTRYLAIIPHFHAIYSQFYTAFLYKQTHNYVSMFWNTYRFYMFKWPCIVTRDRKSVV
jgi:hypothetical protein